MHANYGHAITTAHIQKKNHTTTTKKPQTSTFVHPPLDLSRITSTLGNQPDNHAPKVLVCAGPEPRHKPDVAFGPELCPYALVKPSWALTVNIQGKSPSISSLLVKPLLYVHLPNSGPKRPNRTVLPLLCYTPYFTVYSAALGVRGGTCLSDPETRKHAVTSRVQLARM